MQLAVETPALPRFPVLTRLPPGARGRVRSRRRRRWRPPM